MNKLSDFIWIPLVALIVYFGINHESYKSQSIEKPINYELIIDSLKNELISEVKFIIPKQSNVSADSIVNICLRHDFDIALCCAQAHVESHYGTKGRSRRTKSIFGVGAYDNGRNVCNYSHVNESIEPYIKLVSKYYLTDKTVDELLMNYVNINGKRYASNKNYENLVRNHRNKIINKTKVYHIQNEINEINKIINV